MTDSTAPPRRFAVRSGVALAVLVTAAVAVPGTAAASSRARPVSWAACTETPLLGYDCATYEVPLDHDKPRGATTTIALARRPAADQAGKIGTIFVNPGGPGGPGRGLVRSNGIVAPEVLARFDLVGFDPRGIGASDPIQCFPTDAEAEAVLSGIRGVPLTEAEIDATLAANVAHTEACKANAGPLLTHMSTLNVAKDLDLLRQAVGDDKLTYIGYSYGTLIGATYVNLFPRRVRAVVLDGNVDPDQRTNRRLVNKFERAGGFEIALAGFLRECDAAGAHCVFGPDSRTKFDAIRERFRQGPVEVPGIGTATLDDFTGFVIDVMYDLEAFPEAAQILQLLHETITGTPSTLKAGGPALPKQATGRLWSRDGDAYAFNGFDAGRAVNCADAPLPRNPELYPGFAVAFEKAHRTYGRAEAFSEVGCATWPRVQERYNGPWDRKTSQTVLVVNPTYDPATRYDFAVRMTRQLGNARLLTLDGFGHTSSNSTCITNWYTRYVLHGEVPPVGTRCGQDRPPFPPA
ncbi:alpha/beta fold hydrolase [Paractinoplanes rishiriensis]|uniref:Peptidase n=1 Tax=Paractinoplanes rishiriensis TaxID=1050105 RepID=A0A919JW08_9ACTN|nr:alpha/beta fold hydrolase [Actinoplanes rishiriensis]GIE94173.1 peptidase [Actinoplanes rishiriensis]